MTEVKKCAVTNQLIRNYSYSTQTARIIYSFSVVMWYGFKNPTFEHHSLVGNPCCICSRQDHTLMWINIIQYKLAKLANLERGLFWNQRKCNEYFTRLNLDFRCLKFDERLYSIKCTSPDHQNPGFFQVIGSSQLYESNNQLLLHRRSMVTSQHKHCVR